MHSEHLLILFSSSIWLRWARSGATPRTSLSHPTCVTIKLNWRIRRRGREGNLPGRVYGGWMTAACRIECEFLSPFFEKKNAPDRAPLSIFDEDRARVWKFNSSLHSAAWYLARKLNQNYSYINGLRLIELARSDLLMLMISIDFASGIADKLKSEAKVSNSVLII